MPWFDKEQPIPVDTSPIEGLWFLVGDVLARQYQQDWLKGQTYPLITFPSGLKREVVATNVHLFGRLTVPSQGRRDLAYEQMIDRVQNEGLEMAKHGESTLIVANPASGRSYHLTYDNHQEHLSDIRQFPPYAMELLPGELRALLPKLYANETKGLEAVATMKFFTPDSNWTWYPTEFDGDDTFFGLVSGFEIELGYFTLSELESVRGGLNLPIERDLHFHPTTLHELKRYHEQY